VYSSCGFTVGCIPTNAGAPPSPRSCYLR
jgi:hypothetical protein